MDASYTDVTSLKEGVDCMCKPKAMKRAERVQSKLLVASALRVTVGLAVIWVS